MLRYAPFVMLLLLPVIPAFAEPEYSFLLQNFGEDTIYGTSENPPSQSILNGTLKAWAKTNDTNIHSITVNWYFPNGSLAHHDFSDSIFPVEGLNLPYDVQETGHWVVNATFKDEPFSAGKIVATKQIEFDIICCGILVIPESPIGMIALVLASLGTLGVYIAIIKK